jgi:acylphosphatase
MEQMAKHVTFTGRVQGVGFRYTTRRIAGRYTISGFVRNLPSGAVEMLAQGPAEQVEACIDDIRRSFADSIRDAQIELVPYNSRYTDFQIAF